MKPFKSFLVLITIFLIASVKPLNAQHSSSPKIIAVFNHADWCKGCQIMKPKLKKIKPKFVGRKILFTGFDKTNEFKKEQSEMLATQLGLSKLYKKYKGKTAFVVLVDAKTKEELDLLKFNNSKKELIEAINKVLNE